MSNFKAGNQVYYPELSTKILTVCSSPQDEEIDYITSLYPLNVGGCTITLDGKSHTSNELPCIFHATTENQTKLEQLYNVEFEKPASKPTSKEIIRTLLDNGHKYVCCWVSDNSPNPDNDSSISMINHVDNSTFSLITEYQKVHWKYATPFDPRTGEPITELPA